MGARGLAGAALVDVSRYVREQPGTALEFRLVPDNPRTTADEFALQSAAMRVYAARD